MALAKGMAVANVTLGELFNFLNASRHPFPGVGKYSDPVSSIDDQYRVSMSLGQARNS